MRTFDNKTGLWFDTQKPLVPQLEAGLQFTKKNVSEVEFSRLMENLSEASREVVSACLSPFAVLLQSVCDYIVATFAVICETQTARQEIFECINPQINQYLTKQGISDPEAHIRYALEKTQRGEVLDLLGGTFLDNSTD